MNQEQQLTMQWLADHHISELRSIREAEDSLFSWATSIFLAGFGILTGLRGMDNIWSTRWRLVVMFGIIVVVGAILLMAFLLRRKYDLNQSALSRLIAQLNQPIFSQIDSTDRAFFFVRWGAVGVLGLVMLGLIWMLG